MSDFRGLVLAFSIGLAFLANQHFSEKSQISQLQAENQRLEAELQLVREKFSAYQNAVKDSRN